MNLKSQHFSKSSFYPHWTFRNAPF